MCRHLFSIAAVRWMLIVMSLLALSCGCTTTVDTIAAGVGGTAFLAHSPTNEVEQIYYLGVFDPQEQAPATVYRVRVHGQASAISFTKFASGWVKADLIDSLGTSIGFDKESGAIEITKSEDDWSGAMQTGRRLMLFGPEGFREAPKDHRLVIVMGSNPEAFFRAVDESLGVVSGVQVQQQNSALNQVLFETLKQVRKEREGLDGLVNDKEADTAE
ncbi:MAG: hypothetical protein ACYS29_11725 [Planctomycetota bacterium]